MKRAREYKPSFGESKRSKMDVMRAQKQSPVVISKFFDMLHNIYACHKKEGHFVGDEPAPEDVFNVDEVHANPEAKHRKKLGCCKRLRKFLICSGDKFPFHVTIVITTCADGTANVKPMVIHSGQRMNKNVVENLDDDFSVHLSANGSQDKIGFERWCCCFVESVRKAKPDNIKTFLFLDGHNSRWTYSGLTHLADNNVVVICLPSHTSIITQPNDNGINAKFHEHTGDAVQRWREQHAGMKIQKGDANLLICQAWKETAKESATITKGFNSRTCGICPVDRNAENYRDLKISMAVTPEEEAAKAQTQGEQVQRHSVRQKAHAEFIYFKRRHGTDIVALRAEVLQESQRHWLRCECTTAPPTTANLTLTTVTPTTCTCTHTHMYTCTTCACLHKQSPAPPPAAQPSPPPPPPAFRPS
jgi:hypothetical protein